MITKPLSPDSLKKAIVQAFGKDEHLATVHYQQVSNEQFTQKLDGAHLLLVEDNEINQELASELLLQKGVTVDIAENGKIALSMLASDKYDGILMDCQMPVMDGYEATLSIRKIPEYESIPIIAMTANAMVGDKEKAINVGMNDHIQKPIIVTKMFATLAQWITPSANKKRINSTNNHTQQSEFQLPILDGIDTKLGLGATNNNKALYIKILLSFAEKQKSFDVDFLEAQKCHDIEKMTRMAHSIKVLAGTLGANKLAHDAQILETYCQKLDIQSITSINDLYECCANTLSGVIKIIDNAKLNELNNIKEETENISSKSANQLIEEVRTLLENYDTEVLEYLPLLSPIISDEKVKNIFAKKINEFDFDGALHVLNEIESKISKTNRITKRL